MPVRRGVAGVLQQNQRFVFSLIHKFNQEVKEPYSERDDIIVMSDEAIARTGSLP